MRHVLDTLQGLQTRWLLVFDNYDPEAFNLQKYIPRSEFLLKTRGESITDNITTGNQGEIIITTRHQLPQNIGQQIDIPPLTNQEALELLLPRHQPQTRELLAQGTKIINRVGNNALATSQASAYIQGHDSNTDLSFFFSQYENESRNIQRHTPAGWDHKSLSIFTTWNLSFQRLFPGNEEKTAYAMQFLTTYAFLDYFKIEESLGRICWDAYLQDQQQQHTTAIEPLSWLRLFLKPSELVGSGYEWDSARFSNFMTKCQELSLVQLQLDDNTNTNIPAYSLHPQIKHWLHHRLTSTSREAYNKQALQITTTAAHFITSTPTTPRQKSSLSTHIDAYIFANHLLSSSPSPSPTSQPLNHLYHSTGAYFATFYISQSRYGAAETLLTHLIAAEATLSDEHKELLYATTKVAEAYMREERWDDAERVCLMVLKRREVVDGTVVELEGMSGLRGIYLQTGREGF